MGSDHLPSPWRWSMASAFLLLPLPPILPRRYPAGFVGWLSIQGGKDEEHGHSWRHPPIFRFSPARDRPLPRSLSGLAPSRDGEPLPRQLLQDLDTSACSSPGAVLPVITRTRAAPGVPCFTSSRHVHQPFGGRLRTDLCDATTFPQSAGQIVGWPALGRHSYDTTRSSGRKLLALLR